MKSFILAAALASQIASAWDFTQEVRDPSGQVFGTATFNVSANTAAYGSVGTVTHKLSFQAADSTLVDRPHGVIQLCYENNLCFLSKTYESWSGDGSFEMTNYVFHSALLAKWSEASLPPYDSNMTIDYYQDMSEASHDNSQPALSGYNDTVYYSDWADTYMREDGWSTEILTTFGYQTPEFKEFGRGFEVDLRVAIYFYFPSEDKETFTYADSKISVAGADKIASAWDFTHEVRDPSGQVYGTATFNVGANAAADGSQGTVTHKLSFQAADSTLVDSSKGIIHLCYENNLCFLSKTYESWSGDGSFEMTNFVVHSAILANWSDASWPYDSNITVDYYQVMSEAGHDNSQPVLIGSNDTVYYSDWADTYVREDGWSTEILTTFGNQTPEFKEFGGGFEFDLRVFAYFYFPSEDKWTFTYADSKISVAGADEMILKTATTHEAKKGNGSFYYGIGAAAIVAAAACGAYEYARAKQSQKEVDVYEPLLL